MPKAPTRRQQWLGCGGCLVVAGGLGVLLAWSVGAVGPLLTLLALAAAVLLWRYLSGRGRAIAAFRAAYAGAGKDVLVVYTDSPHWQEHIETHWLARWGHRAVVLDRSKPWREDLPEARLWRAIAGTAEHTPVVIVVPPSGRVQIVRFFLAFRDAKHGKDRRLRDTEAQLARILGESPE